MHCLGAVAGGIAGPSGVGSCSGVLGVVRALGVLVSEGRVQGPPRGYKEGPHCGAPLQAAAGNHVCKKDDYLCDRYVVLVREIADRVATGTYLCVEVLLCTDCPCGLAKSTSKDPVLPIQPLAIAPWQQPTEMLLEYWCISVLPSKGPEMMNTQGLYQAVRSRLHFSQVAAWWSRSKGTEPSYIATRLVAHSDDSLRKFRETPTEHTFPSACCGDGNSIKVTVWALPRMEDVPFLSCPIHPMTEKDEEGAARALTPTKNNPAPVAAQNPETLVLPALVDDRLQTPCNEPGKHHCRCEDEDGSPPSPFLRPTGERKRRRSMPCGPDVQPCATSHIPLTAAPVLPAVRELADREQNDLIFRMGDLDGVNRNPIAAPQTSYSASPIYLHRNPFSEVQVHPNQNTNDQEFRFDNWLNSNADSRDHCGCVVNLERCFTSQLSIEEHEGNVEKRYKRSAENSPSNNDLASSSESSSAGRSPKFVREDLFDRHPVAYSRAEYRAVPLKKVHSEDHSWPSTGRPVSPDRSDWRDVNFGKESGRSPRQNEKLPSVPVPRGANLFVNPFRERSPFHESNPGPSTYSFNVEANLQTPPPTCSVPQSSSGNSIGNETSAARTPSSVETLRFSSEKSDRGVNARKDLTQLMSKLAFPEEVEKSREESGILNWISKVPSRVLGVTEPTVGLVDDKSISTGGKFTDECRNRQNCNLELSQREFDEVLAVLRARTPSSRRRGPLRTIRRRDKLEKHPEEGVHEKANSKTTATNLESFDCPVCYEVDRISLPARVYKELFCKRSGDSGPETAEREPKGSSLEGGVRNSISCSSGSAQPGRTPPWLHTVHPEVVKEKSLNLDYPGSCNPANVADDLDKRVNDSVWNGTNSKRRSTGFLQAERRLPWQHNVNAEVALHSDCPGSCNRTNGSDNLDQRLNTSVANICNVSNKADVLLGAILRTSKESRKGLSDISNGARPRTVASVQKNRDRSDAQALPGSKNNETQKVKPFEDDKSLPFALNKRLHKLKQLFKKEQDKRIPETVTSGDHAEECLQNSEQYLSASKLKSACSFRGHPSENRVKRRIDFADFSESSDRKERSNSQLNDKIETDDYFSSPRDSVEDSQGRRQVSMEYSTNTEGHNDCASGYENQNGYSAYNQCLNGFGPVHDRKEDVSSDRVARSNNHDRGVFSPGYERQNSSDTEESETSEKGVPSAIEQERFRRSLENAASMVFHSRTGLPLTSSPAPLRRGSCCFDYDSSLNSVSSKRSALFELNTPPSPGAVSLEEGDRETEITAEGEEAPKRRATSRSRPHSHALLGSFEESALNGRLEPVSTVHGFAAELGASGSFCPKHRKLPVTVFFYTLGDNDKVSTPYLAHINLGKKGYQVPRRGTIQVTLLNPLGTVVKMFVVRYDLSDMPPRSHTFLRQRTLRDKTLRYLVHLRFMSGKSGRMYLHTDIRMIICRKSDVDTASDFGTEPPKELRSYIHGPENPKFSPRC